VVPFGLSQTQPLKLSFLCFLSPLTKNDVSLKGKNNPRQLTTRTQPKRGKTPRTKGARSC